MTAVRSMAPPAPLVCRQQPVAEPARPAEAAPGPSNGPPPVPLPLTSQHAQTCQQQAIQTDVAGSAQPHSRLADAALPIQVLDQLNSLQLPAAASTTSSATWRLSPTPLQLLHQAQQVVPNQSAPPAGHAAASAVPEPTPSAGQETQLALAEAGAATSSDWSVGSAGGRAP